MVREVLLKIVGTALMLLFLAAVVTPLYFAWQNGQHAHGLIFTICLALGPPLSRSLMDG